MNQRGDVTLFCVLSLLGLSCLLILCSLELRQSLKKLEARSHLLLCVKETKGEFDRYMKFMGRTNWALKNVERAKLIALFIPGLQGAALEAEKAKNVLVKIQDTSLGLYFYKLSDLKKRNCPLDPRMIKTPFALHGSGYLRGAQSEAKLRNQEWTYYFLQQPYALEMSIKAQAYEGLMPKIKYLMKESAVTSHFLSSFLY